MDSIDLRSDTVTCPTEAMYNAMATAEVGDDVFGEDPTVNRLEALAAEKLGKQAALFAASGTMANLICQMVHCQRGDEMIVGDKAHIFYYEQGGSAAIAGIHPRTAPNQPDGSIDLEDIEAAVRTDNVHFPRSRLIALENTHNRCYGTPLTVEYMKQVVDLAQRLNLKIHVDGARIFNAAAALNVSVAKLVDRVDSVCFCLSKGLAAPVGSMVCGSADFIKEARRARKVLGGAMRQAGVLAAAGLVALNDMAGRLVQDHENAATLAARLNRLPGLDIDLEKVKSNIVYVRITAGHLTAAQVVQRLAKKGVRVLALDKYRIRIVTHYHITKKAVLKTADIFARVIG
ncbi:MAG: low-specificity L-threonine aldolase [Desulfobacteraceae bacterium]|nr:low-specificity L-threonine aldolase [Desulfobacteraceae bacterium]